MTGARWSVTPLPDPGLVDSLVSQLEIPRTLATILVQRGYESAPDAKRFLRPRLESLSDPYLLPDLREAVELVVHHVEAGNRIMVHGDYDVDGQCATALLTRVLEAAGADVVPFVPHRMKHGYDFGPAGVEHAVDVRARMVITCDCGTAAHESVQAAREQQIEVVVTDHHLPRELPPANAVVNPRREGADETQQHLCGTGVAFKLAQALVPRLGLPGNLPFHLLDLVAMATVADIVPLVGENRILVRHGLKLLQDSRWPGLRALVGAAGLEGKGEIRAGQVGFVLAPRLNAVGRIDDAMEGVRLLLEDDPGQALYRARKLEALNQRRQSMDQEILEHALRQIQKHHDLDEEYGLVLAGENWHPGVIGIVASRIVERFHRPTVIVGLEGDTGRGSGRSITRFDLFGALTECAEHLVRFGGHRMAAGFTIRRDRIDAFRAEFNRAARNVLSEEDLVPEQRVDFLIDLAAVTPELEKLLRHLEPYGPGNPAPVFGVTGALVNGRRTVGTNHLKFRLTNGKESLETIGFGWADRIDGSSLDNRVDAAFKLDANVWNGTYTIQGRLVDLKPTDAHNSG